MCVREKRVCVRESVRESESVCCDCVIVCDSVLRERVWESVCEERVGVVCGESV